MDVEIKKQKATGANGTTAFLEMAREQIKKGVPGFKLEIREDAPDNFGIHWRGWRVWVTSGNVQMYIHTGLVYHPDTRAGIYTEIDRGNNRQIFDEAWENIRPSGQYDLSKDENDYLKFFFPSCRWNELMEAETADKQEKMWYEYFKSVLTELSSALRADSNRDKVVAEENAELKMSMDPQGKNTESSNRAFAKGFSFSLKDLSQIYILTKMFAEALQDAQIPQTGTEVHLKAADKFGLYSAGARLFIHDGRAGRNLYLWCGLLFTDEKKSGLIIEADRYSNQDSFDVLRMNLSGSDKYETEISDGFIKLFLPQKNLCALEKLILREGKEGSARQILDSFIKDSLAAFAVNAEYNMPEQEDAVYAAAKAMAGEVNIVYAELVATFSQLPVHERALSDPQTWMEASVETLKKAAGCECAKTILSVNPEGVTAPDRYTLYLECEGEPEASQLRAAANKVMENYTGWKEKIPTFYDGEKITVMLERAERRREN